MLNAVLLLGKATDATDARRRKFRDIESLQLAP